MTFIIKKLPEKYDASAMISDYEKITQLVSLSKYEDQICLNYPSWAKTDNDKLYAGVGSAYNSNKIIKYSESEFNNFNDDVFGNTIYKKIYYDIVNCYGNIGRVRLMLLKRKSCLSLHVDLDALRYHIPILTNDKCFYVHIINDKWQVSHMPDPGQLYMFNSGISHTVVNASKVDRIHLVFNTCY